MPADPIDTKLVQHRREVHLSCLGDLAEEVVTLRDLDAHGRLHPIGNWSAGQIFQHLARLMDRSVHGFEPGLPLPARVAGRAIRVMFGINRIVSRPPPPGMRLPEGTPFLPDDDVTTEAGAEELLALIDAIEAGARFDKPSPLLGFLTHDQWERLHLRHAEHHLSFLIPD